MRRAHVALLTLLALLAGCAAQPPATTVSPTASVWKGARLDRPYDLPDVTLTVHNGRPFALRTGSDKPVLVLFFGYSNCPDICQSIMADLATALTQAGPAVKAKVQVVFVTMDPKRDTPAVLAKWLPRFDPDFIGLTGDLDQIVALGEKVGIAYQGTTPQANGGYEVTHSTQVIGFERTQGVLVWTQGTAIGSFTDDFTRLAEEAA